MTIESEAAGEFLGPREFLARAMGKLGVTNVDELDPARKAQILFAFHMDSCDRDEVDWLPQLDIPEDQKQRVRELIGARGSQMMILGECLTASGIHDPNKESLEFFCSE